MDSNARYHARRRLGLCGRNGCANDPKGRSLCPRHLEEQKRRSKAERDWFRDVMRTAAALGLLLFAPLSRADEAPKAPENASCLCPEAENGARAGESLEQRATRLERAWRLTRAERWMANRKRGRK